ncbi:GyrI-like domain-containing protein [Chitinophaga lutea]
MEKLDLSKQYKSYYTAKSTPAVLEFGPVHYISIAGAGDPSGDEFAARVGALYAVAYTIKFMAKTIGRDFTVPKLEGLWWFDATQFPGLTMPEAPTRVPRSAWSYRLLLRLPDFITKQQAKDAAKAAADKKDNPLANEAEFFELNEGKVVQVLHTGPFATENETLEKVHAFCVDQRFAANGLHHEIYLSDFRKTAPEKLRTILREPVK